MHNLHYLLNLMDLARKAIIEDRFPAFIKGFFATLYRERNAYPSWAVGALRDVGVDLLED